MNRLHQLMSRVKGRWYLLAGFVLLCCAYEYGRVFGHRPFPNHLWRQTNCLSLAWMFYQGIWNPFTPAVQNLLLYNVAYARTNHLMRTRGEVDLNPRSYLPVYHCAEIAHWNTTRYWDKVGLLEMEPYARSIGISAQDSVICVRDKSVCTSLYLMGQRRWMDYGNGLNDSAAFQRCIDHGANYLFVLNANELNEASLRPFEDRPIGGRSGISIFDLRAHRLSAQR